MENIDKVISLMAEADILEEQVTKITELRERLSENELIVSAFG